EELDKALLEEEIPPQVIQELRAKWSKNPEDDNCRFQFASALCRSGSASDKRAAIQEFEYFLAQSTSPFQRESIVNVITTQYALAEYQAARNLCEALYRSEPDNQQVRSLHQAIAYRHQRALIREQKQQRDATIGIAVGVGAAAAALALSFLLAPQKK
ncbi:hypothetical protein B484DRAFT_298492, partial [Ochromonadaceae sp. CCMP2298]